MFALANCLVGTPRCREAYSDRLAQWEVITPCNLFNRLSFSSCRNERNTPCFEQDTACLYKLEHCFRPILALLCTSYGLKLNMNLFCDDEYFFDVGGHFIRFK